MGFDTPQVPVSGPDERELLLGFIAWQRQQVVATTAGLTEEQLRWTPDGALVPLIGVVNHLAMMERRWIEGRFLGSPFPPRTDEWVVDLDIAGAEVLDAYAEQAQRSEAIVRAAPALDVPCLGEEDERGPLHRIFGVDRPVDLRWVLLHVLEETAHHAGHADATRELLDGTRMRA
jgi:uncharacterized damage-inducible protein DinB